MGGTRQFPAASLMGWIALLLIGAAAFAALAVLRVGRVLWSLAGAALMLGAAGYALQGRPMLVGHPVSAVNAPVPDDDALIDLRTQVFGRFGRETAYLVAADGLGRAGQRKSAVQAILGGLRGSPRSVMLWTSLGDTLAAHDAGQVSPAALFAYRQAGRLEPANPGPPLFLGIAYVRAGDLDRARALWTRAYALTHADAPYRPAIATRLAMLDRLIALRDAPAR